MGQLKGHLHYGGSISPKTSQLGKRPQKGTTYASQKRYETIIRLEAAAFPHTAIAAMLCISPTRLSQIKKEPAYLAARVKLTHGIIIDYDQQVASVKDHRSEILLSMLPPALQVIAEEIQRPANSFAERRQKISLAQDILDRQGMFAKVSKTEIKPVEAFDFEKADSDSMSVIHALTQAARPQGAAASDMSHLINGDHHTEESVRANNEFSNSHTLDANDQQRVLDELEVEALRLEKKSEFELLRTVDVSKVN